MEAISLLIGDDAAVTGIYSDELAGLLECGTATVRRASNVEPHPEGGWIADMSPSGSEVRLGPFRLRAEALAAEVAFLEAKLGELYR